MPDTEQGKKRYNLRDVARHAGVSVATVSRVLNTPKQVSPTTLDRVQQSMTELRFVPSAAARAINSGRTRMVAALLPTLDNSIYARVVDGLENRLSKFGLSLIVGQTGDDPDIEYARARQMVDIGAEGLVVTGITHNQDLEKLLNHTQMPTVAVSHYDPSYHIPTVGYDNGEAASVAARHLHELGHRRIAVVHGPAANNDRIRQRIETLLALDLSLELDFVEVAISNAGGCEAVDRILRGRRLPTGVLCQSDVLAAGALNELQRREIAVPDTMSVMGIEDLQSSEFTFPRLTSVRLHVQEMGELAAEALANWLDTERRPEPIRLSSTLIRRESTALAKD